MGSSIAWFLTDTIIPKLNFMLHSHDHKEEERLLKQLYVEGISTPAGIFSAVSTERYLNFRDAAEEGNGQSCWAITFEDSDTYQAVLLIVWKSEYSHHSQSLTPGRPAWWSVIFYALLPCIQL